VSTVDTKLFDVRHRAKAHLPVWRVAKQHTPSPSVDLLKD
jgi:hypothetical protein